MTPRRLEVHPLAAKEARKARRWYAKQSSLAADRFMAELDRAIQQIVASPQLFPPHWHGTRFYRIPRFPYLVIYLEDEESVQVLAVAHGRRRPA